MNGRGHSGMCHNRTNDGKSCQSCIELERIEAQIVETQEALDRLRAKHLEIQTKANHSHDSLMRRLPPEIVANVFQLYMPTLPADNNLRIMGMYAMKPPLILGAVCRAWRQITLTIPQLWNFVKMKLTYTYNLHGRCDYAQKRLARAGELPITICLDIEPAIFAFDTVHDLLDAIIQCSDRWHVLDLRCHSSAFFYIANQVRATPILHTLRLLVADVPLSSQRSLRISDATPEVIDLHGAMLINAIDANWIRVTRIHLSQIPLSECLQLLTLAPYLERCTFSCIIEVDDQHFPIPTSVLIHNGIQELIFEGFHRYPSGISMTATSLLQKIDLPTLRSLTFDGFLPQTPELSTFLKRSACPLRELVMTNVHPRDDEELILLLEDIPSLRRLECFPMSRQNAFVNEFFKRLTQSTITDCSAPDNVFLPELESASLSMTSRPLIEWERIARILETQIGSQNSIARPLHTVKIHCAAFNPESLPFSQWYIDKDSAHLMQEARQLGFHVEIGDRPEGFDLVDVSIQHHASKPVIVESETDEF